MTTIPAAVPSRLAQRIDPGAAGCWMWTGSTRGAGYGHVSLWGRPWFAHRAVYFILVGDVPEGLQLDHLCRNRRCVNPAHLEPVTSRENILRGISPAAEKARQTHCIRGHALTGDNIRIQAGRPTQRACRACRRQDHASYKRRHRVRLRGRDQAMQRAYRAKNPKPRPLRCGGYLDVPVDEGSTRTHRLRCNRKLDHGGEHYSGATAWGDRAPGAGMRSTS